MSNASVGDDFLNVSSSQSKEAARRSWWNGSVSLLRLETAPPSLVSVDVTAASGNFLFFVRLTEGGSDHPQRGGCFQVYHKACEQRNILQAAAWLLSLRAAPRWATPPETTKPLTEHRAGWCRWSCRPSDATWALVQSWINADSGPAWAHLAPVLDWFDWFLWEIFTCFWRLLDLETALRFWSGDITSVGLGSLQFC